MKLSGSRDHLDTERPHPDANELDQLPVEEAFDLFQAEDEWAARALAAAREPICAAIQLIVGRMQSGGRLFYLGAGTSGRLGVLDAAECPPTFLCEAEEVQGLIAGGERALRIPIEGAEDDELHAVELLEERGLRREDVVLGISAGGTTPFVHAGLAHASRHGAATVFLACVPTEQVSDEADISIRLDTGPELVAGSTRLKAGTATKLVLNRISTLAMVARGKVHGCLMVDVDTSTNAKLVERGVSILCSILGIERQAARDLLDRGGGRVKRAALMHARRLDPQEADQALDRAGGFLRVALEEVKPRSD